MDTSDGEPRVASPADAPDQNPDYGPDGGVSGEPYGHVVPADVGNTIGAGVVGAIPTTEYAGPMPIPSDTVVENVVINECVRFVDGAINVTLRNVIVNCDGLYPVYFEDNSSDITVEYSRIVCSSSSKTMRIRNSQRGIVRNNELIGCQDFFYIEGVLETLLIEDNYMHSLIGSPEAHADGFQIGQGQTCTGDITIRGNYFDPDNDTIGKTDILFATRENEAAVLMENNFFHEWGWYTLRCNGVYTPCTIRNNIYEQGLKTAFSAEGRPSAAYRHSNPAPGVFECNRYEDGDFIEQEYVKGVTHSINSCPNY